jgi:hypothetical protein
MATLSAYLKMAIAVALASCLRVHGVSRLRVSDFWIFSRALTIRAASCPALSPSGDQPDFRPVPVGNRTGFGPVFTITPWFRLQLL